MAVSSPVTLLRLSAPYVDVAHSSLHTLVYDLPFYADTADNEEEAQSRDILALLPHADVFDAHRPFSPPMFQLEPSYTNVITIQESRRLRRSQLFTRSLDLFLTQPFDIQSSILEFLHPLDLRSLSRTSKTWRRFLLDPTTRPLWEHTFAAALDHLPKIPDGVPLLRWVDLLFGETRCDCCGNGNSFTDFILRCRLCDKCRIESLIEPRSNLREFIASSWISVAQKYAVPSFSRGKALRKDVDPMTSAMDSLQGQPELLSSLQQDSRKAAIAVVETAEKCNAWRERIESRYLYEWVSLRDFILKKLTKRLRMEGYDPQDLESAQPDLRNLFQIDTASGSWIKNKRITDAMWNFVLGQMRPRLRDIRAARLARLRQQRIDKRETQVTQAYQRYFKANLVSPWLWPELPPVFALFKEPTFHDLIHSYPLPENHQAAEDEDERPEELPEDTLTEAFDQLADNGWMDTWRGTKMRELAQLLPSSASPPASSSDGESASDDVAKLDLATSIFWCLGSRYGSYTAGRCLIGWEGSAPHLRCGALRHAWGGRLHFNERGSEAARECVRMTGVWRSGDKPGEGEIDRVTAVEMDELDRRFICANCPLKDYGDVKGRLAMTWRECVAHHIDKTIENHIGHAFFPRFILLSPKAEAHVKTREHPDPHAKDKGWSCNHCGVHCNRLGSRDAVIRHVKEAHVMSHPVERLDYIYFPNATYRTPRSPITFQESPTLEFECAKCQARGLPGRLYCAGSIQAHLSRKHGSEDDVQPERDVVKISNVLYEEPPPHPSEMATPEPEGATRHVDEAPSCA